MITIGSLFSGIGGLELGLERALGARTVWQVEIDAAARRVLQRHWAAAQRFTDVRDVGCTELSPVDVVCGGFPCQDISPANTRGRAGLSGKKSGLWNEYSRIVESLRPRWVVVENVTRGEPWVPTVRRDLWGSGYTSVSIRLRANQFGAPHGRDRTFVIAHADGERESRCTVHAEVALMRTAAGLVRYWGDAPPGGFRLADGVPRRMERNRQYGNAVMPVMAEFIGRLIEL
jgi:DNA (cytosine-5)-methyltransferase 1